MYFTAPERLVVLARQGSLVAGARDHAGSPASSPSSGPAPWPAARRDRRPGLRILLVGITGIYLLRGAAHRPRAGGRAARGLSAADAGLLRRWPWSSALVAPGRRWRSGLARGSAPPRPHAVPCVGQFRQKSSFQRLSSALMAENSRKNGQSRGFWFGLESGSPFDYRRVAGQPAAANGEPDVTKLSSAHSRPRPRARRRSLFLGVGQAQWGSPDVARRLGRRASCGWGSGCRAATRWPSRRARVRRTASTPGVAGADAAPESDEPPAPPAQDEWDYTDAYTGVGTRVPVLVRTANPERWFSKGARYIAPYADFRMTVLDRVQAERWQLGVDWPDHAERRHAGARHDSELPALRRSRAVAHRGGVAPRRAPTADAETARITVSRRAIVSARDGFRRWRSMRGNQGVAHAVSRCVSGKLHRDRARAGQPTQLHSRRWTGARRPRCRADRRQAVSAQLIGGVDVKLCNVSTRGVMFESSMRVLVGAHVTLRLRTATGR